MWMVKLLALFLVHISIQEHEHMNTHIDPFLHLTKNGKRLLLAHAIVGGVYTSEQIESDQELMACAKTPRYKPVDK